MRTRPVVHVQGSLENYYLIILKAPRAADRHLFIDSHRSKLEFTTNGATHGHNASGADNAFSVAALSAKGATAPFAGGSQVKVENYSSDGPRRIYYSADGRTLTPHNLTNTGGVVLKKPDLTAADEITTDVVGLTVFRGTRAAAPHAAAIAALLLSYNPRMSPTEVRKALTSTALKIETKGWNVLSGSGIVMPVFALEAAKKVTSAKMHKSAHP